MWNITFFSLLNLFLDLIDLLIHFQFVRNLNVIYTLILPKNPYYDDKQKPQGHAFIFNSINKINCFFCSITLDKIIHQLLCTSTLIVLNPNNFRLPRVWVLSTIRCAYVNLVMGM